MPSFKHRRGRLFSLDTETTGVDLYHEAAPFFVTICHEDGTLEWWEWEVDPLTRRVRIPREDAAEIVLALKLAHEVVMHNAKFDARVLTTSGILTEWDWQGTQDTLRAAHLLGSNQPKDLTSMALLWLGRDIEPYEKRMEEAVQEARRWCRSHRPDWRIAAKDQPGMPSAKEKTWKYDCWLLRAVRKEKPRLFPPEWDTLLRDYANADSAVTMLLWPILKAEMKRRGVWEHYCECMKLAAPLTSMEARGVTINEEGLKRLRRECRKESDRCSRVMINIASGLGASLTLPKGGRNGSLDHFCFEVLKLPAVFNPKARTSKPSLDSKHALPHYLNTLPPKSKARKFIELLSRKRGYDTAIGYLDGYERFCLPMAEEGWWVLHPNVNPTGTDTLRRSHSNPNSANVSKQSEANLRSCFGPAPGREWWAFDAQNLELRIPAYEAEEREMIALFEKPEAAPYFGSVHALMFHTIFPKEFDALESKNWDLKHYAPVLYQRVKNGDFAVQYGSTEQSGTADKTYGKPGAFRMIKDRFGKLHGPGGLNERCIEFASKHGYVETLPDRTVNPQKGYPLLCSRTTWGGVKPTVPLNYRTQGTAGWWMMKGMIRVHAQLEQWRKHDSFDGYLILEVHDELVVDFPKGEERLSNLPRAKTLAKLMMQSGADLVPCVPTPVAMELITDNWANGAKP